jgi:hypothetical protein
MPRGMRCGMRGCCVRRRCCVRRGWTCGRCCVRRGRCRGACGRSRRMGQGPVCKLTSRGSGRGGGGTIESGPFPNRSTREARCAWVEVRRNPAARMLENAAIVAAKMAMVEHGAAARKVGGMVIEDGAAVPVRRPGVETPAVVSKQSDGNAYSGKSESQTYGQAKRRRSYIKAPPGRNPSAV